MARWHPERSETDIPNMEVFLWYFRHLLYRKTFVSPNPSSICLQARMKSCLKKLSKKKKHFCEKVERNIQFTIRKRNIVIFKLHDSHRSWIYLQDAFLSFEMNRVNQKLWAKEKNKINRNGNFRKKLTFQTLSIHLSISMVF